MPYLNKTYTGYWQGIPEFKEQYINLPGQEVRSACLNWSIYYETLFFKDYFIKQLW